MTPDPLAVMADHETEKPMSGRFVRRYFRDSADGKPLYFEKWVGLGPKFTDDLTKAARFDSRQVAEIAASSWEAPMRTEEAPS